jgi:prepilin-type N-terminal cleavage/methylation domain-containing protein
MKFACFIYITHSLIIRHFPRTISRNRMSKPNRPSPFGLWLQSACAERTHLVRQTQLVGEHVDAARHQQLSPFSPSLTGGLTHSVQVKDASGFTLIELLVVLAIMAILAASLMLALPGIKSSGDVTRAAYDVQSALENARSYATANNTYVWVGFFEEDASQTSTTPATAGIGRIVISIVASKDGTMIYNPGTPITSGTMTAGLFEVVKLFKVNNMHLKTAVAGDAVFPLGDGTGNTFTTRPIVTGTATWQIGDTTLASASSQAPFQFPVGNPAPTAQYTFQTAIQFSPRGEAGVNVAGQSLQPVIEIGLQPTHGATVDTKNKNVIAVQITGIAGNVNIYRQ